MATRIAPLTKRQAWKAREAHYSKVRDLHLRTLISEDPKRVERMTVDAVGIYFDYSKNRITDETVRLLLQLAEESGLRSRIDAMFGGEKINVTITSKDGSPQPAHRRRPSRAGADRASC